MNPHVWLLSITVAILFAIEAYTAEATPQMSLAELVQSDPQWVPDPVHVTAGGTDKRILSVGLSSRLPALTTCWLSVAPGVLPNRWAWNPPSTREAGHGKTGARDLMYLSPFLSLANYASPADVARLDLPVPQPKAMPAT